MRISRHQMFMEIAQVVAKRATCFRENVGCIIVKDNNIISMGYNGAPAGQEHCTSHPNGNCQSSIHAEINALLRVTDILSNKDLYCTHLPCIDCQKAIAKAAIIKRVFFSITYGDIAYAQKFFDRNGIQLLRILPSGTITSPDRVEMINVEA